MITLTRRQLLDQTRRHPYVGLMTSTDDTAVYRRGEAYVWLAEGPLGPLTASLGSAEVLPLLADLQAADLLERSTWTHLPRTAPEVIAQHVAAIVQDDWYFLWTTDAPGLLPDEARVYRLGEGDAEAIEAVLDDALPGSSARFGDPRIRAWFGIRTGGRLVAVAADQSRGETGFLAGIAVLRDHQGRGLGAALTAAATRSLLKEYAAVALGVAGDNAAALRLYERLGYRHRIERTSVQLG